MNFHQQQGSNPVTCENSSAKVHLVTEACHPFEGKGFASDAAKI